MSTQLDYYNFMEFNPLALKERYAPYADRFRPGSRVLDVGCGRGEFLELLAERRIEGVGVDADEAMVGEVRRKGLHAELAQGSNYLQSHPAEFDGIFVAHLLEHLPPEGIQQLVAVAAAALRPGGRLVLVTPNPENLQMQLRDFWIDLQHIRFYSPQIVRWIVHQSGLREIEVGDNANYRSGPGLGISPQPELPLVVPPQTLKRRLLNRLYEAFPKSPIERRVTDLEIRSNQMLKWIQSLYPAAEYFVTAIK